MDNVRFYWRFLRFLCRWATILHLKVRVHGVRNVPRQGAVLLVCNHQSHMDPVLVSMALPRESCYMARDSLWASKWFGKLITSLNAFPVKRNTADLGAIKESLRRLKQGMSLVVFPEGTRTPDGRIHPMFPGLASIARKAGVPIVPVLIDGMYQAWPKGSPLPKSGNVIIRYGEMIQPAEYAALSAEELVQFLRKRLIEMQHRLHATLPERRMPWYSPRPDVFEERSGTSLS
jgi:1-acyl-sn-glycerol-3-phosphate acyltransferase